MIRKTHSADSWNRAELRPQAVIKGDNLGIVVSCLPGIYLEGQHVFPAESKLDRRQVRERPQEQSGRYEDEQRHTDLRNHQNAAQAQTPKPASARDACPQFLERGDKIPVSRLQRRRKSEEDSCEQGERGHHRQHMPVQLRAQGKVFASIGQQQRQETDSPDREGDSQRATQHGQ